MTAPDGINVPRWVCDDPQWRTVMSEIITVRLDVAKHVFQAPEAVVSISLLCQTQAATR